MNSFSLSFYWPITILIKKAFKIGMNADFFYLNGSVRLEIVCFV